VGWRIVAWSREQGRGRIESDVGVLDFDGHVAMVSDFVVGEEVEVSLEPRGDSYVVRRIWPASPPPPLPAPDEVPESWRPVIDELSRALSGSDRAVELAAFDQGALRLVVHDQRSVRVELVLAEVEYLQLPRWGNFARVHAATWEQVARDPDRVTALGFAANEFAQNAVIVALEPEEPSERLGLIVAYSAALVT
jgi:hypothetical protein